MEKAGVTLVIPMLYGGCFNFLKESLLREHKIMTWNKKKKNTHNHEDKQKDVHHFLNVQQWNVVTFSNVN